MRFLFVCREVVVGKKDRAIIGLIHLLDFIHHRAVELLTNEPLIVQDRSYGRGDRFLCLIGLAESLYHQGKAKVVSGGRLHRGAVKVKSRLIPLYRLWDEVNVDHPALGPIKLRDSDLFLRCGVRRFSDQLGELFDWSPLIAGPGHEFFTSYSTLWHRVERGFSIGPDIFSPPTWGSETAPLLVFDPQVPS